jgi:arylsulfatase A-like enzyme
VGRKILLITTDQQRYDSLGCNGNTVARTPVIDGLAASGCNFRRAYNQNTVCMPARSTILTGQYVRTHGVVANGIPLPLDAPTIAGHLAENAGYRTALFGKAHFEPGFDLTGRWEETARALRGDTGPWRGFERSVQAMHVAAAVVKGAEGQESVFPLLHYGSWLAEQHPEHLRSFAALLSGEGGGDTGAPETKNNPIPREWYHTDWIADLAIAWMDELRADDDWFTSIYRLATPARGRRSVLCSARSPPTGSPGTTAIGTTRRALAASGPRASPTTSCARSMRRPT